MTEEHVITLEEINNYIPWMEQQVSMLTNMRPEVGLEKAAMLSATHSACFSRFGKTLQSTRGRPENTEQRQEHERRVERLHAISRRIIDEQVNLAFVLAREYRKL
jgi:hypothetical protein